MRTLPKKAIALATVAGLAFVALVIIAVMTSAWTDLLLGVIASSVVILILLAMRGQQSLRSETRALSDALREVASRPLTLSSSADEQGARTTAQFDWIARRQAEIVRLLKADSVAGGDNVTSTPGEP